MKKWFNIKVIIPVALFLVASAVGVVSEVKKRNLSTSGIKKLVEYDSPNSSNLDAEYFKTVGTYKIEKIHKYDLGKNLFFDQELSGSKKTSCNSCHNLKTYGVDNKVFSIKDDGTLTKWNTPSIYNLKNRVLFLHDGSVTDIKDLFTGDVNHLNMLGESTTSLVSKLRRFKRYQKLFNNIYKDGINIKNYKDALSYFLKNLSTPKSKFDRFLSGDILSYGQSEAEGYMAYKDSGCMYCHHGENLGGNLIQSVNIFGDKRLVKKGSKGLFDKTKVGIDLHLYKVPSLRNVGETAPYLYDGSTSDLAEVIRLMFKYQLKRPYTEAQIEVLLSYLKSLTGVIGSDGSKK